MKKSLIFSVAAAGLVALSSCGAVKTITQEVEYTEARVLDVSTASKVDTVSGRLVVNPNRIEETWTFSAAEVEALGKDMDNVRARAAFKTLQKNKADELLAPLYDVTINPNGSWTVVILGYLANINWK